MMMVSDTSCTSVWLLNGAMRDLPKRNALSESGLSSIEAMTSIVEEYFFGLELNFTVPSPTRSVCVCDWFTHVSRVSL